MHGDDAPRMSRQRWDRYTLLVAFIANGPMRVRVHDELQDEIADGMRNASEVVVSVQVDLFCRRCDTEIAALEPDDVDLADVVSVIAAHEPVCDPSPSWPAYEQVRP